jgi:hypothetical protein
MAICGSFTPTYNQNRPHRQSHRWQSVDGSRQPTIRTVHTANPTDGNLWIVHANLQSEPSTPLNPTDGNLWIVHANLQSEPSTLLIPQMAICGSFTIACDNQPSGWREQSANSRRRDSRVRPATSGWREQSANSRRRDSRVRPATSGWREQSANSRWRDSRVRPAALGWRERSANSRWRDSQREIHGNRSIYAGESVWSVLIHQTRVPIPARLTSPCERVRGNSI